MIMVWGYHILRCVLGFLFGMLLYLLYVGAFPEEPLHLWVGVLVGGSVVIGCILSIVMDRFLR